MRRIQQEAEAIPLPDDKQSNNQWVTASDLAKRIADEKRKTKNKKRVRQPADGAKPKTAHAIARDTLASERKIGKCIWPQNKDTVTQNSRCGWAKYERFWRSKEGQPHPVFYYRLTTEEGWQEKENERQEDIEPNAEPS